MIHPPRHTAHDTEPEDLSAAALQHAVLHELDRVDRAATDGDAEVLLSLARAELPRLATGLHELLSEHRPDDTGRCPRCVGTPRGRPWPCAIWQHAHRQLIGQQAGSQHSGSQHSGSQHSADQRHGRHAYVGESAAKTAAAAADPTASPAAAPAADPAADRCRTARESLGAVIRAGGDADLANAPPGQVVPGPVDTAPDRHTADELRATTDGPTPTPTPGSSAPHTPPSGTRLETDYAKIYRAAVNDDTMRSPEWPPAN